MQVYGCVKRVLYCANARDVIDVRVGQQDVLDLETMVAYGSEEPVDFVARIDDHSLTGPLAADHESVLIEGRFGTHFDDHSLQSYT